MHQAMGKLRKLRTNRLPIPVTFAPSSGMLSISRQWGQKSESKSVSLAFLLLARLLDQFSLSTVAKVAVLSWQPAGRLKKQQRLAR